MLTKALPSFFTIGNLFLGVISIILTIQGFWEYAAILVIIGMLFDGLDGRFARILNTQSQFGKELDSLSDIISFGLSPSIIMYVASFKDLGPQGWIVTSIFPICGALRLARFNSLTSKVDYFTGLPITIAGGVLATVALYKDYLTNPYILVFLTLFLSFLMVSKIRYPGFKQMLVSKKLYWLAPTFIIVVITIAIFYPTELPKLVFIPLGFYVVLGLKMLLKVKKCKKKDKETKDIVECSTESRLDDIDEKEGFV